MRVLILILSLGLMVAESSQAAPVKKSTKAVKASKTKKPSAEGNLQTDVSFNDSVLRGEYQAPEEALVKVENEKGLSDLLGVRKHFKDRLVISAEQE